MKFLTGLLPSSSSQDDGDGRDSDRKRDSPKGVFAEEQIDEKTSFFFSFPSRKDLSLEEDRSEATKQEEEQQLVGVKPREG